MVAKDCQDGPAGIRWLVLAGGRLQDGMVAWMLIIDRFEGDWAVIEDGNKTFNLPRKLLPKGAREGDAVLVRVTVDREGTAARADRIRGLAADLFRD